MAASRAVTQVPMLAPSTSAIPCSSEISPWLPSTMMTPVVADELWIERGEAGTQQDRDDGIVHLRQHVDERLVTAQRPVASPIMLHAVEHEPQAQSIIP